MAALNMNESAASAAAIDDGSNDSNNKSPTSPPRLVNIATDSALDNIDDNNNANGLSKPLQDIKEEYYNNNNDETESAVECINQLSFSSPATIKMTSSLCNNTIDSTSSSTSHNSNNKPPTANDNTINCKYLIKM